MDGEKHREMITPLISNALQDFQNGDIIQGLLRPITDVFGSSVDVSGGYVFAILFGIMFGMITLKTQSVVMPVVVLILLFPTIYFIVPPESTAIFYAMGALGVTGVVAKIYLSKGGG